MSGYLSPFYFASSPALGQVFVTIGNGTDGYPITYFGRAGDVLSKVGQITSGNRGTGQGALDISDDGIYLAEANNYSSGSCVLWKYSSGSWSNITAPSITLPSNGVSFAPSANYLCVVVSGAPRIYIFKRSGDTFSNAGVTITGALANNGNECVFSRDGNFVHVALQSTPFVESFSRSADTFTKLSNPASLPGSVAAAIDVSPDGSVVAVGTSAFGSPLYCYSFNGTILSILSSINTQPSGGVTKARFSKDAAWLAVGIVPSPYLQIYAVSGTGASATFTLQTISGSTPGATVTGVDFDSTSTYCAVSHTGVGSPAKNVSLYKLISGTWTYQHGINILTTDSNYRNLVWDRDR